MFSLTFFPSTLHGAWKMVEGGDPQWSLNKHYSGLHQILSEFFPSLLWKVSLKCLILVFSWIYTSYAQFLFLFLEKNYMPIETTYNFLWDFGFWIGIRRTSNLSLTSMTNSKVVKYIKANKHKTLLGKQIMSFIFVIWQSICCGRYIWRDS